MAAEGREGSEQSKIRRSWADAGVHIPNNKHVLFYLPPRCQFGFFRYLSMEWRSQRPELRAGCILYQTSAGVGAKVSTLG